MNWRLWSLAVLVAVGLTTAAFLGTSWLVDAVCLLLAVAMIELAHLAARRRTAPRLGSGDVDVEAFQFAARMLDGTRFRLEQLSPGQLRGPEGLRLMEELHHLERVMGEETAMPIMNPISVCPSCDVQGAHLAELNGTGWRRICWECGHRWTEYSS